MIFLAASCEEFGNTEYGDKNDSHKIPNNMIWYTSSDAVFVTPYETDVFGANIISNVYENGMGIITFDGDVTSIGDAAFRSCRTLTSITIPNTVTTIGEEAFVSCHSLINVTIPNSVTVIDGDAFRYCNSLTSIDIPNSVTSIGEYAFDDCSSLISVTISDNVTSIGDCAFRNCTSLQGFYGRLASADNRCIILNGILHSFAPAGLTTYIIPNSATSIGNDAFSFCGNLISITIPDSVTSIEEDAFSYCNSLASVTIGNSVTSIGETAFSDCSSLTSVYCKPTTPPTLDYHIFSAESVPRIYVPAASVEAYQQSESWRRYVYYIYADSSED